MLNTQREEHHGVNGLLRVIEQLAGVPLPASLWESQILRARIADYQPAMLDELLASGEVIWCGHKALGQNDGLISLHLTEYAAETLPMIDTTQPLTPIQQATLDALSRGGSWFVHEIMAQMDEAETQTTDVYAALWQLVWQGYVTADSWIAVRGLLTTPGAPVHVPRVPCAPVLVSASPRAHFLHADRRSTRWLVAGRGLTDRRLLLPGWPCRWWKIFSTVMG